MSDHENKTETEGKNAGYTFPVPARREAVIVESSSQYTVFSAELSAVDGFSGRDSSVCKRVMTGILCRSSVFRWRLQRVVCIFTPTIIGSWRVHTDPKVSERRSRRSGRQRVYWKNCSFRRQIGMAMFFKQLRQCDGAVRMPGTADGSDAVCVLARYCAEIRRWTGDP